MSQNEANFKKNRPQIPMNPSTNSSNNINQPSQQQIGQNYLPNSNISSNNYILSGSSVSTSMGNNLSPNQSTSNSMAVGNSTSNMNINLNPISVSSKIG